MTPEERQLISGLFDRMRSNGPVEKDRDAESLINQAVRQTPDSAYLLVQSVLAQEHYLQQASGRIEELEARMRDLEDELARQQQSQAAPQRSGGSFLGGLFGGGQAASQPAPRTAGSAPAFGGRDSSPQYGQTGSPWGQQPSRGYAQQAGNSPWSGQQPAQQQAPARGGGFMASALTTAAGVAGGMLAANAISNMLGGGSQATAAHHPSSTATNSDADAERQAQLDAQQDAEQDAELANEQYASYDDSSDSDWGGADDSEF
ncbi:MAG: DUF2076 domain-containing protein [Hyphomicrobiaceae bacterium]